MHQAIVGKTGWAKFGPSPAENLTLDQVNGMLAHEHRNHVRNVQLLTTIAKDFDVDPAKAGRIVDKDAWAISLALKEDPKHKLTVYFDKTTGQVLGDEAERIVPALTTTAVTACEKASLFLVVSKSWMDVDGMKMPEQMSIYRDGKLTIEVLKAEAHVVDAIDPKVFEKPK